MSPLGEKSMLFIRSEFSRNIFATLKLLTTWSTSFMVMDGASSRSCRPLNLLDSAISVFVPQPLVQRLRARPPSRLSREAGERGIKKSPRCAPSSERVFDLGQNPEAVLGRLATPRLVSSLLFSSRLVSPRLVRRYPS